MRRTLTISVLLLVLGGCGTTSINYSSETEISSYKDLIYQPISKSANNHFYLSVARKDLLCGSGSCGSFSMDKGLGFGGHFSENELWEAAKEICKIENKGRILHVRNPTLSLTEDFSFECLTEEENKKRQERLLSYAAEEKERELKLEEFELALEKERILAELEIKKDKCRTYGFKDETDGMGMCLIELDKLAEIEKQTKSIEANSTAQAEAVAKQEAKEKKRREAQALIDLGNILSGKGKASCSFKCSGGQVVQGSCQKVTVSVGTQTCWKQ